METKDYEIVIGRLVLLKELLTEKHKNKVDSLIENLIYECMEYECQEESDN